MVPLHHDQSPAPVDRSYDLPVGLGRSSFAAMGTTVAVLLPDAIVTDGTACVRAMFAEWEQMFSRFRPTSELTHVNEHAGSWTTVSEVFYSVLTAALTAAQATAGVFDPALNTQMRTLGYSISFHDMHGDRTVSGSLVAPGGRWQAIQLNPQTHQVLLPAGVGLDFGGIAKGMAVDAACTLLTEMGVAAALVNAGGDLRVLGLPLQQSSWSVAIPSDAGASTIAVFSGALATSSLANRRWTQGGQLRHHLLDPRSGSPALTDIWSVTVAADQCQQAEVAAKVALILGSDTGRDFLVRHQLAAQLLTDAGERFTTGCWPSAGAYTYISKGRESDQL